MGKNDKRTGGKSSGKGSGKGKGGNSYTSNSGKSRHNHVEIRTAKDIAEENEEGFEGRSTESRGQKINIGLYMWEFGQNDPKRDSGSKLKRLGYAKLLSKSNMTGTFPI